MQASEIAEKVLTLASAYDNRQIRPEVAVAWKAALDKAIPDATVEQVQNAVVEHFATSTEYLTVAHVIDIVKRNTRRLPHQIGQDVRAARAHGLISKEWPETKPLPADVETKLTKLRDMARQNAVEIETVGEWPQLQIGQRT